MSTHEPEARFVRLAICDLCLDGMGGECHVPGCAFWMAEAPTSPLRHAIEILGVRSK